MTDQGPESEAGPAPRDLTRREWYRDAPDAQPPGADGTEEDAPGDEA